jgi:phosphoribosylformimino-5-aminoimidazole carboxamide ribonucleotide (ProFAR) isomerase
MDRLRAVLSALDGDTAKLVIDLSCRRKDDRWFVATNKWQTITDFELNKGTRVLGSWSLAITIAYTTQSQSPSSNPTAPSSSSTPPT